VKRVGKNLEMPGDLSEDVPLASPNAYFEGNVKNILPETMTLHT
jgi:hypothetical protein